MTTQDIDFTPSPQQSSDMKSCSVRTSQDILFPVREMQDRLFRIEDDLLYACITYGDGLASRPVEGFTWTKGMGYAFLTFFVQRALHVYRFPFFPDRVFEHSPSKDKEKVIVEIVKTLTPQRIDAISDELLRLYEHTQSLLRDKSIHIVHLKRMVREIRDHPTAGESYAQTIMRLKRAAQAAGKETIAFELDVINSWGDDGGYPHYPIMIQRIIPTADILYFSNMIASREVGTYADRFAVEPGEWVVLNRSPTGLVDFAVNDIVFDETVYQEIPGWRSKTYETFLENHSPFPFRKAARINERWVHGSSGWRLTAKGRWRLFLYSLFGK
ncbi:hypothetical protein [Agrobacterium sp. MCAB5]|uniref:hypothetical protein n=1 Tax=Agrobacterium sp. MCAB5 TaxID=3233042 RepID=UPI003F8DFD42